MHLKIVYGLILLTFILSGCYSNLSGDTYSREEARKVQKVEYATLEHIRPVVIEGTKTPIGAAVGAVAGGIAGSAIGRNKGSQVASVIGATIGGIMGASIEEQTTRTQGEELTLRLEDGQVISVIQAVSQRQQFSVGQRVRILRSQGNVRVSP